MARMVHTRPSCANGRADRVAASQEASYLNNFRKRISRNREWNCPALGWPNEKQSVFSIMRQSVENGEIYSFVTTPPAKPMARFSIVIRLMERLKTFERRMAASTRL